MKPPANVYEEFNIFSQTLQMTFVLIFRPCLSNCVRGNWLYT